MNWMQAAVRWACLQARTNHAQHEQPMHGRALAFAPHPHGQPACEHSVGGLEAVECSGAEPSIQLPCVIGVSTGFDKGSGDQMST